MTAKQWPYLKDYCHDVEVLINSGYLIVLEEEINKQETVWHVYDTPQNGIQPDIRIRTLIDELYGYKMCLPDPSGLTLENILELMADCDVEQNLNNLKETLVLMADFDMLLDINALRDNSPALWSELISAEGN